MYNAAGAEASQWDGTDMIFGWGWGLPHSKETFSQSKGQYGMGTGSYYALPTFQMSSFEAYVESKTMWKQEIAVENAGGFNGGLGEWHGDMNPFADEGIIQGGMCAGGDAWHRGLLLGIVQNGLVLNAYVTRLETLHGLDEVDCFIGINPLDAITSD